MHFSKETIDSKAVPAPKLLIEDHKKPNKEGNFPTRTMIPATNFTAGFPTLGFSGIENTFDKNNVNGMKRSMTQASDLKDKLENLNITEDNSTIALSDIVSFFPSIKFSVTKEAVKCHGNGLTRKKAQMAIFKDGVK